MNGQGTAGLGGKSVPAVVVPDYVPDSDCVLVMSLTEV